MATRTLLRPSSAPRWGKCAGSHVLEALYPEDEDSPKAREGTAAHFYVTEAVQGRVHPVGTLAPNGHPIDAEMVREGAAFVRDVEREVAAHPGASWRVETLLTAHALIHPDCEGTPDAYLLDLAAKRLIVWDYKYGHGYVEPFGNEQMLCYVAGIFEAYELTDAEVADLRVSLRIVQPRNYDANGPVRAWDTTGAVCTAEIEVLRAMAEAAKGPDPRTVTGPHCDHCDARHACPALLQLGSRIMDMAGRAVPFDLANEPLGSYLRNLDIAERRLKALRTGLEEQALAEIRAQRTVPGWTIGYSKSREVWTAPVAEITAMADLLGVDVRKPAELITPNQARDKGLDASVIAAYSSRPTGKAKLVPQDETTAAKAFT